jgi:hypothetical protein
MNMKPAINSTKLISTPSIGIARWTNTTVNGTTRKYSRRTTKPRADTRPW